MQPGQHHRAKQDNFDKLMLLALIKDKADFTHTSLLNKYILNCISADDQDITVPGFIKLGKGATKRTSVMEA